MPDWLEQQEVEFWEAVDALIEAHDRHPELRMYQLIYNALPENPDPFYTKNGKLADLLRRFASTGD